VTSGLSTSPLRPTEVSAKPVGTRALPPRAALLWSSPLVQSSLRGRVSPALVWRSRSAVGACPGRAVFRALAVTGSSKAADYRLSSSLALLWRLAQLRLVRRRGDEPTLMDLHSLQHIQGPEIHPIRRRSKVGFVPPSGFGYPLDGFLPLSPRRPCFVPTALMGFHPSEPLTPRGKPGVSDRLHPHVVDTRVFSRGEAGRCAKPRPLGFDPRRTTAIADECLAHQRYGRSRGLCPSKVYKHRP
jgi:hypothetical protein